MNLLIINHYAQTPAQAVGTRHFFIAKNLKKHGWNVSILCASTDHRTGKQINDSNKKYCSSVYDEVNFIRVKCIAYKGNGIKRIINIIQFACNVIKIPISILKKKPDFIIGSTVHPLAALAGYIVAKKMSAKFLYEVRDIWPQTLIDMKAISKRNPVCFLIKKIDKFLSVNSEKIISVAPNSYEHYAIHGVDEKKISYIPNGIDVESFGIISHAQKKVVFDIYYIGAHGKVNSLEVIIDAARIIEKKYPNIRINFIGNGPEKKSLQSMANGLSNILFHDAVPKTKIAFVCQKADCFVLSAKPLDVYKYGISFNKIFDYMAGTRPIIFAYHAKNNPIEAAKCGITVPPENPKSLANAFIEMFSMPEQNRMEMAQNARKYVEKFHDHKNFAKKLSNILLSL